MDNSRRHIAVLGASPKPARYANQCTRLLKEYGYRVTLVSLGAIGDPVDTLTLYVGPQLLEPQVDDIVHLKPGRVIFNPGTESLLVQKQLDAAGIDWLEACTLVMLRTGQF